MKSDELLIYTDGGCIGNPGPGGWAAILVRNSHFDEIAGHEEKTTNNRMEMRAAVEALRRARSGERVRVITDSRYLLDGITKWIHAWKRRGWHKADGDEVLNRDLWQDLDALCRRSGIEVAWEHVRGHAGHPINERCDELANGFARGRNPKLRHGDGSWISGACSPHGYPAYLSLVEGELRLHPSWADCEARVKGAKGARHKKVRTADELRATQEAWGVGSDASATPAGRSSR